MAAFPAPDLGFLNMTMLLQHHSLGLPKEHAIKGFLVVFKLFSMVVFHSNLSISLWLLSSSSIYANEGLVSSIQLIYRLQCSIHAHYWNKLLASMYSGLCWILSMTEYLHKYIFLPSFLCPHLCLYPLIPWFHAYLYSAPKIALTWMLVIASECLLLYLECFLLYARLDSSIYPRGNDYSWGKELNWTKHIGCFFLFMFGMVIWGEGFHNKG